MIRDPITRRGQRSQHIHAVPPLSEIQRYRLNLQIASSPPSMRLSFDLLHDPPTMVLHAIPIDIFLQIIELVDQQTLLNLRLVSYTIHEFITPLALRDVRVFVDPIWRMDDMDDNSRLETCASPLPNLYRHARHLRFCINGDISYAPELLPALWRTIAKMQSVTSFTLGWDVERGYGATVAEDTLKIMPICIASAVESLLEATRGKLERLTIEPSAFENWFPPALSKFRGLKSLRVVRESYGYDCRPSGHVREHEDVDVACSCVELPMSDIFGPLIAANPGIEELEIVVGCQLVGFDPNLVLPTSLTKLASLSVGGLNFARKGFPVQTSIDPTPLRNLRHLRTPSSYGPLKLDVLWTSLRQAHITLDTLVTEQVSLPLIQYLASFSCLRSLEIYSLQDRPECASSEITSMFVTKVLPCHAETLENLHISFDFGVQPIHGWILDFVHWPLALSGLVKLRTLAMHPPTEFLSSYNPKEDELVGRYQSLIDVERIPKLERFALVFVRQRPGFGCAGIDATSEVWRQEERVATKLVGRTGRPELLELFHEQYLVTKHQDRNGVEVPVYGWVNVESEHSVWC